MPTNTSPVAYVVPAGYVFLMKSALLMNIGSVPTVVYFQLFASTGGTVLNLPTPSLNAGTSWHWEGWIALNEGDSIHIAFASADGRYWISGAQLTPT